MAINPFGALARMFSGSVKTLAASSSITVDARGSFLTVIVPTGGTVDISRVDSASASAHTTGAQNAQTLAANTRTTFSGLEWGFYRLTANTQPARYFSSLAS